MICLYCGQQVEVRETYNGLDVLVCDKGHRTVNLDDKISLDKLDIAC